MLRALLLSASSTSKSRKLGNTFSTSVSSSSHWRWWSAYPYEIVMEDKRLLPLISCNVPLPSSDLSSARKFVRHEPFASCNISKDSQEYRESFSYTNTLFDIATPCACITYARELREELARTFQHKRNANRFQNAVFNTTLRGACMSLCQLDCHWRSLPLIVLRG